MGQYPEWQTKMRQMREEKQKREREEAAKRAEIEAQYQKEIAEETRKLLAGGGLDLPEADKPEWELDGYKIKASKRNYEVRVWVSMAVPGAEMDVPEEWLDEGYRDEVFDDFYPRNLGDEYLAARMVGIFEELPIRRDAAVKRNAEIEARYQAKDAEVQRVADEPVRSAPYWEVETIVDDPVFNPRDEDIEDRLNAGWVIVSENYGQCLANDGVLDRTRVTRLKKLITPSVDPEPEKRAGVEVIAEVVESIPSPDPVEGETIPSPDPSPVRGEGSEETVIECEPVAEPVARVLPGNMVLLDAQDRPLVQFADGVTRETSYEEAIKRIDVDAEQLGAIHEAETERRVSERLAAFRSGEISFEEAVAAAGIRAAQAVKDDLTFEAIRQKYAGNMAERMKAAPGFARG